MTYGNIMKIVPSHISNKVIFTCLALVYGFKEQKSKHFEKLFSALVWTLSKRMGERTTEI